MIPGPRRAEEVRSERPSLRNSIGPTRRTEGVRVQGRSARVVEAVLQATAEELGKVGFLALRIDDVAERSGVNKTTIYRRWATKEELVAGLLERFTLSHEVPDTGSLRGDLTALLSSIAERAETDEGRGILRVIQAERGRAEFAPILRKSRTEHLKARKAIFERAIARGEIPAGSDVTVLVELVVAPLIARLLNESPVDANFIRLIVATVAVGAAQGGAVPEASPSDR
jgi:AcrR family transcriptional regulator